MRSSKRDKSPKASASSDKAVLDRFYPVPYPEHGPRERRIYQHRDVNSRIDEDVSMELNRLLVRLGLEAEPRAWLVERFGVLRQRLSHRR